MLRLRARIHPWLGVTDSPRSSRSQAVRGRPRSRARAPRRGRRGRSRGRSRRSRDGARPAARPPPARIGVGTTTQKPQPMLKTSHISAGATSPELGDQLEHRRRPGSGARISKPDSVAEPQQVQQPPPVMWARPWTASSEPSRASIGADVDHGRLEQDVGHGGAAELRRGGVQRQTALLEQGPAGQRQAVGVNARGGQADQGVPGGAGAAVDDPVQGHGAERRAHQVEPVRRGMTADHLGQLADLAAGDLDPGRLGADPQPDGDLGAAAPGRRAPPPGSRAAPAARRRRRSGR